MWDPFAEFEKTTLPNGLDVYVAHWPGRKWEAMQFVVHAGAAQDPVGKEGAAHFVEHLVSKNAKTPYQEIKDFFGSGGGRVSLGATGMENTRYDFFCAADRATLGRACGLFAEVLLGAKLENVVEREREVILGEYFRSFANEEDRAFRRDMLDALYAGKLQQRFMSALGDAPQIAAIAQADLQAFCDRHYAPANMSVVAVGGATMAEMLSCIEGAGFAEPRPGKRVPRKAPLARVGKPASPGKEIAGKDGETTAEYFAFARIPGVFPVELVGVFGEMLDRALFREVRERRAWTYNMRSKTFRELGEYQMMVASSALTRWDGIRDIVAGCIAGCADAEDEFAKVKTRRVVSAALLDIDGCGVAERAANMLGSHGRIVPLAETVAKREALTMDDIRALAGRLSADRWWTWMKLPDPNAGK